MRQEVASQRGCASSSSCPPAQGLILSSAAFSPPPKSHVLRGWRSQTLQHFGTCPQKWPRSQRRKGGCVRRLHLCSDACKKRGFAPVLQALALEERDSSSVERRKLLPHHYDSKGQTVNTLSLTIISHKGKHRRRSLLL